MNNEIWGIIQTIALIVLIPILRHWSQNASRDAGNQVQAHITQGLAKPVQKIEDQTNTVNTALTLMQQQMTFTSEIRAELIQLKSDRDRMGAQLERSESQVKLLSGEVDRLLREGERVLGESKSKEAADQSISAVAL